MEKVEVESMIVAHRPGKKEGHTEIMVATICPIGILVDIVSVPTDKIPPEIMADMMGGQQTDPMKVN